MPNAPDDLGGPIPPSALPPVKVRVAAFASTLVAGLLGGLIGWGVVDVQCHGDCTSATGIGAVIGAAIAAGGVAVVAVLVMRAMGEWRRIQAREATGQVPPSPDAGRSTC